MTGPDDTEPGDIVQVSIASENWRACLVIVTEVRDWGIIGFTPTPPNGAMAFIRLAWNMIHPTGGKAVWSSEP